MFSTRRPVRRPVRSAAADRRPRTAAGSCSHAPPHAAAQVERLEDRTLLTVYTVNSLADGPPVTFPNGELTLREAVTAASTNQAFGDAPAGSAFGTDLIQFDLPGLASPQIILSRGQLPVVGPLAIEGLTFDGARVRITGGGSRLFDVFGGGLAVFQNLDLTGGAAGFGGAVLVRGGSVVGMAGVTASGNTASVAGGAVAVVENSLLSVEGPNTLLNNAAGSGGAVFVEGGSRAQLLGNGFGRPLVQGNAADDGGGVFVAANGVLVSSFASFVGNTTRVAGGRGGAVRDDGGGLALFDTTFTGNFSQADGGAVSTTNGFVEIQRGTLTDNQAVARGGAVALEGGVLVVGDTTFANNFTDGDGGAVSGFGSTVAGFNADFVDNAARNDGGAFAAVGGSLTADNFRFGDGVRAGNAAGRIGGGLSVRFGTGLLRNSLFHSNAARFNGGGLAAEEAQIDVTDSSLIQNGAVGFGGGVNLLSSSSTLTRVTVGGNVGLDGGGVSVFGGVAVLVDTLLDGNAADFSGGGLGVYAGAVVASLRSAYTNNGGPNDIRVTTARLRRETLAVPSDAQLQASGVNVANIVADVGGGIFHAGQRLTLQGGRVAGNVAVDFPALFVANGSVYSPNGVTFG